LDRGPAAEAGLATTNHMPAITVQLAAPIHSTFRAQQVAGMFDLPLGKLVKHELTTELPGLDETWTIGAIVGPSGCGKTTLARAAFPSAAVQSHPWPENQALLDSLDDPWGAGVPPAGQNAPTPIARPTIKELVRVLTAVGLGSVPTWLKPYRVLSGGERFRADLARAIIGARRSPGSVAGTNAGRQESGELAPPDSKPPVPCLVFDEFTSTLDRTIAKTTSAALARLLRRTGEGSLNPEPQSRNPSLRFVALSCHTDILPWLAPDWVLELKAGPSFPDASGRLVCEASRLTWGGWPPPVVNLEFRRVPQAAWAPFAPHHYLAGGLAASATCYGAFVSDRAPSVAAASCAVAFCAVVTALGWQKSKRITRLVTLPQFQGLGIASRMLAHVAQLEAARGNRVTITAGHPAIVAHCARSPSWRLLGIKKHGSTPQRLLGRTIPSSTGRAVASFEFITPRTTDH
jgi:GNAT superfamily N-acetyltransferase